MYNLINVIRTTNYCLPIIDANQIISCIIWYKEKVDENNTQ